MGTVQWARRCPLAAFLVWCGNPSQPKKGRRRCNQSGQQSRSCYSKKQAKREKRALAIGGPLSLRSSTRQIMKLYQARMQIEEGFRDSENRYGLSVAKANRIGQQRRTNLLLIAALAAFLLWCIGVAGKNQPIAKQVRVNSSSKRDPYLVIFPAHLLLRQPAFRLLPNQLWQSLTTISP